MANSDFRRHVLDHYNRFSSCYDWSEFIRRETRRRAVALSDYQPGEKVLDVCTGTGELALTFVRRGADVVGVDIAPEMLRRAAAKQSSARPTWMVMDAIELAFASESFDISVLSLALHHMPETVQWHILKELRRVTRKCLVIVEPNPPHNQCLRNLWAFGASLIDESELLYAWAWQDFNRTCSNAGLKIRQVEATTFGLFRITLCDPDH